MSLASKLEEALGDSKLADQYPASVEFARRLAAQMDSLAGGELGGDPKDIASVGRLYLQTLTQLGLIPAKTDVKGGVNQNGPVNPLQAQRDAARARRTANVG